MLFILQIFFRYIYTPYKLRTAPTDMNDLLSLLYTVVNSEIEVYENDVFNDLKAINNSNFENFYNDITKNIMNSLSEEFFIKMRYYLNDEAVASIIARRVKSYLSEKIYQGT